MAILHFDRSAAMIGPRRSLVCLAALPALLAIVMLAATFAGAQDKPPVQFALTVRFQTETSPGSGRYHTLSRTEAWEASKTALIVCDVWDLHHCLNAVRRVEEFGPRLNEVVQAARQHGVTIIHAPSDCMEAYAAHPARRRAIETPRAEKLPDDITSWCSRIPAEEKGTYPIDQSDGGEDDDPTEHAEWAAKLEAMGRNPKAPWKRQADLIEIDGEHDFISDKGDEVWSILAARGIDNVILTGVHTNMCVLGRPFGLRQMARNGKRVVLMRDMTDTMYNPQMWPYVSHFTGTDLIVSHIEKYVCPTITSDQFLGGEPFRFQKDQRPHLAIVMAEDEYETERTLPVFAGKYLGKDFRVSYVFGSDTERGDIPGLDVLDDADVAVISVRRRPLRPEQLAIVRRFADAGKPLVGIRTASHAFHLRNQPPPEGLADWPEFDAQVWGGHYSNHYGNDLQTRVQVVPEQKGHPILTGVRTDEFDVGGSLYVVSPLEEKATVLMTGRVEGKPPEPVAYTFQRVDGGRSFYTSLGYKTDFESNADFQRLLLNGIYWAAGLDVPAEFHVAGTIDDYRRHWMPMPVPGTWAEGSGGVLAGYHGPAWYRCFVRIPASWQGARSVTLRLRPHSPLAPDLESASPGIVGHCNGQRIGMFLLGDDRQHSSLVADVPASALKFGEANLVTFRVGRFRSLGSRSDGTRLPIVAGLDEAPTLSAQGVSEHAAATGSAAGRNRMDSIACAGDWQFRIGDDPAFASLPLPAKFAAATDAYFEPLPE